LYETLTASINAKQIKEKMFAHLMYSLVRLHDNLIKGVTRVERKRL